MRFVLSSQNGICLLEKQRVKIKNSKNLYGCAIRHFHDKNMGGGVNLDDRAG